MTDILDVIMIRHIAMRVLVALLTFIIGLSVFALWNDFHRQRLSPCDSMLNSINSEQGLIRIRGMLYGSPDGRLTFNESECRGVWAAVEFDQSFEASTETRDFIVRLNNLAGGDRMARAEVILTGTFTTRDTQGNEPPFVMSTTALEQTGAISLISLISN